MSDLSKGFDMKPVFGYVDTLEKENKKLRKEIKKLKKDLETMALIITIKD